MYPIGIVTHNRPVYLDATLRSLSASALPADLPLIVYDDASDEALAHTYLYSQLAIPMRHRWPTWPQWQKVGLGILAHNPTLHGLEAAVEVVRIAGQSVGVGNASCFAIRDLFRRWPDADGVILLQDDVVFNADWYERLTAQAGHVCKRGGRQGIVAGIHLDAVDVGTRGLVMPGTGCVRFATAQCYLIRRTFFEEQRAWFMREDHERKNFDKNLCLMAAEAGYELQLMVPYVCQHIGFKSEVRPNVNFYRNDASLGRIGHRAKPPFVIADSVRRFAPLPVEASTC